MNRWKSKIFRFGILALSLFSLTFCASTTSQLVQVSKKTPFVPKAELVESLRASTVTLSIPTGAYKGHLATGIVIHSSRKFGTFILTNFHAVNFFDRNTMEYQTVPTIAFKFENSPKWYEAEVIGKYHSVNDEPKGYKSVTDIALIWSPFNAVFDSYLGYTTKNTHDGDDIFVISFAPDEFTTVKPGMRIERDMITYRYTAFTPDPVIPGNSGSGVFNKKGKLIGLIFAISATPEHEPGPIDIGEETYQNVSYFTPIDQIVDFLQEEELLWALTVDTSDDPKVDEKITSLFFDIIKLGKKLKTLKDK